jgi:hypothetical protein
VATDGASIGEVHVDVTPNGLDFWNRFVAQTRGEASKVGNDLGTAAGKALADKIGAAVQDGIQRGGRSAATSAAKAGEESGGRFADTFKKRVEAALKSLPQAKITADSSDAEVKIAALRAELADLSSKKVGVDIDDALAVAQLNRIREELDRLGAESPNVQVQVDAAAAAAELAVIQREIDKVARAEPTIQVDADTGAASAQLAALGGEASVTAGGMQGLIAAGIALGPAIVPAAAAAAGAVGALGAVAFAAGAAIGVAALAIIPVIAAVKAMSDAEGQAGQAASTGASRQLEMAGAIDQVRSARSALANTTANAADSERRAGEQVATAERNLTSAQQAALTAQRAINDARDQARRSLEDLNNQVTDNALAQRRAALDLEDAQRQLDAVRANPAATARQREEAQLTFDQAKQQVLELGLRQRDLAADATKANKAGVEGSTQVVAAKAQEQQAQQKVADSERALADARAAQAAQQRQNAFAIAQASQAVVSAQRAVQAASISAGNEGGAAANKLATAMAALSPAGQAFAQFLYSLKPIFTDLSKAAQEGFLPGLQAGIQALLPIMPQVTEFVRRLAGVMGELARQALTALASPFWQDFFKQMADLALPLLQQMGPIILNVAKGFAGLLLAFAPLAPQIGKFLLDLSQRFADFATTLSTNTGFQAFLKYVTDNGPLVAKLIGDLAVTFLKLAIALAPLGELLLKGLVAFFDWLSKQSPGTIVAIAAGIGAVAVAIVLLAGGPVTLIVAGVTLVVGALVYAYTHFKWLRDIVNDVAAAWWAFAQFMGRFYAAVWDNILKPAFEWLKKELPVVGQFFADLWTSYIGPAFHAIGDIALWLWHNILEPAFQGIAAVIGFVWNTIIKPAFDAISFVIGQILAPLFLWLWHHVIEPVWQGIHLAISIAWALIQVIFGLIEIYIKAVLAPIFSWLWHNIIEPVWHGISDTISFVWNTFIRPVLHTLGGFISDVVAPEFKKGIDALGRIWDGLVNLFKVPIRFVVQTILNDGLLGAYNWIASKFGVKPDNVRVALPAGFASGGFTGAGAKFEPAGIVHRGEYVFEKELVAAHGVGFFDWLRANLRGGRRALPPQPGDGSQGIAVMPGALPGFADGGFVGALKSAWNALTDPIGWVKNQVKGLVGKIPGAGVLTSTTAAVGNKLIDGTLGYIGRLITDRSSADGNYRGPISAQVADVQNWIRTQNGKPYIWAGAGPAGWDCSGFVGSVILALQGQSPYHRIFSTSNEASWIRKPAWTSPLTVGWANPGERGGGSVGHTAGNLAGLPFESGGALGNVHSGAGSTPVTSFAHIGSYDTGGILPPGLTIAHNDTGRDEYVFTGDQMRALGGRSGRGDITIPVYGSTASPVEIAAMVKHELAWELR